MANAISEAMDKNNVEKTMNAGQQQNLPFEQTHKDAMSLTAFIQQNGEYSVDRVQKRDGSGSAYVFRFPKTGVNVICASEICEKFDDARAKNEQAKISGMRTQVAKYLNAAGEMLGYTMYETTAETFTGFTLV